MCAPGESEPKLGGFQVVSFHLCHYIMLNRYVKPIFKYLNRTAVIVNKSTKSWVILVEK